MSITCGRVDGQTTRVPRGPHPSREDTPLFPARTEPPPFLRGHLPSPPRTSPHHSPAKAPSFPHEDVATPLSCGDAFLPPRGRPRPLCGRARGPSPWRPSAQAGEGPRYLWRERGGRQGLEKEDNGGFALKLKGCSTVHLPRLLRGISRALAHPVSAGEARGDRRCLPARGES